MPDQARIGDAFTCGDNVAAGSDDVIVNGLPAARLGDATTGHGCWGANSIAQGAESVIINGIPASYVGHSNQVHCCPPSCHKGLLSTGSPNVETE